MQEVCGPSPRFSDDDGDGDWLAEIEMTLDSTLEWMVGKNLKSSRFLLHLPYSTIDDVLPSSWLWYLNIRHLHLLCLIVIAQVEHRPTLIGWSNLIQRNYNNKKT